MSGHENGNGNGNGVMTTTGGGVAPMDVMADVIGAGDLARLSPHQRVTYYGAVCQSLGLNPLTKPFDFIQLNGRLVLYATKGATDQLRAIRGISIRIVSQEVSDGVLVVSVEGTDDGGRTDSEIGAVSVENLRGEALANGRMKAVTKGKRRLTLSMCGLGMLDETEVGSVPSARSVRVDTQTGEIVEAVAHEVPGPAVGGMVITDADAEARRFAREIAEADTPAALRAVAGRMRDWGDADDALRDAYRARMVALDRAATPDLPDDGRPPEDGPRPGGVTKPQMGKIWAVAREKLGDAADEALHAMASETHELGLTPTLWDLTRADASELIEYLSHTDEQTLRADLGPVVFDWRQKRDGNGSGDGDGPPDASTPTVATEDVGHEAAFAAVMDGMPGAEAPARDWGA